MMQKIYRFFLILGVCLFYVVGCAPVGKYSDETLSFVGPKLVLPEPQPAWVESVVIDLDFPVNHKLLPEAGSKATILTPDYKVLTKGFITGDLTVIPVDKKLKSSSMLVKLDLFYCQKGDEGLCLMKNVLLEAKLDPALPKGPIRIRQKISAEY